MVKRGMEYCMNDDFGKGVSTIGNAWYEGLWSYGAY